MLYLTVPVRSRTVGRSLGAAAVHLGGSAFPFEGESLAFACSDSRVFFVAASASVLCLLTTDMHSTDYCACTQLRAAHNQPCQGPPPQRTPTRNTGASGSASGYFSRALASSRRGRIKPTSSPRRGCSFELASRYREGEYSDSMLR